ncbi:MAG: hypothetical protein QXE81_02075 [Desulfurococcaceae archaeon]
MSLSASNTGIFSRFTSIFKPKDPLKREIIQSASIIDRMIRSLEFSKKSLENIAEDHKRKLKTMSDDPELKKILDDEIRNINGYISIISKTMYDLARIKYRLDTLIYVEEPLKILPEIIEEVRAIEPVIEKINPELINHIKTLEQKVASIIAISSSYIPGITRISELQTPIQLSTVKEAKTPPSINDKTPTPKSKNQLSESLQPSSTPMIVQQIKPSMTESKKMEKEGKIEALEVPKPVNNQIESPTIKESSLALVSSNIPVNVIEQWILEELKINNGILDIKSFERKYGVARNLILQALTSLESKNLVKIRRKT